MDVSDQSVPCLFCLLDKEVHADHLYLAAFAVNTAYRANHIDGDIRTSPMCLTTTLSRAYSLKTLVNAQRIA